MAKAKAIRIAATSINSVFCIKLRLELFHVLDSFFHQRASADVLAVEEFSADGFNALLRNSFGLLYRIAFPENGDCARAHRQKPSSLLFAYARIKHFPAHSV